MADFSSLDRHLQDNRQSHLEQLFELLRIPSISADSSKKAELEMAAKWVKDKLEAGGLHTELISGDGPPLVYAETKAVPGQPVVLVYGHYDVQPADPLELWNSPPFEPVVRNGNVVARGATDDKGQMLTHVHSVLAWLQVEKALPLQVKFLIEGQEENGSQVLQEKLASIQSKLACDVIVISDSSQYAPGQPAITYGLRGIAYYEIRVHGPKADLHSGSFGGAVTNPGLALARILTEMKTPDGKIQLPGFYDSVVELEESERAMWKGLNFSDEQFAAQLGVSELTGEVGYSTLERRWARPTLDVHGLIGGYQGEGGKTIIPSWMGAKISFRLVPNQDPKQVTLQLQQFLSEHTPPGVRVELIDLHGGRGVMANPHSKFMQGAMQAVQEGFETKPVLIREGGSIPIVAQMVETTGADVLLLGWGLDDDGAHSPNEKFCLEDYYRGIRASTRLWHYLANRSS
jgi:acetylornithine deacetylase/succinyl-diaminopimelate desuccinylase-like protein